MSRISTMGVQPSKSAPRFYLLAGLLLTVTASATWADAPHSTISLRYHNGQTDDSPRLGREKIGHLAATYLYNITPSFSLGIGYLDGASQLSPFFSDDSLSYEAFVVIAEGRIALSKRNSLYGRLSGLKYDYDIFDAPIKVASENGTSVSAAVGWSVRFNSGIGFEVGYEYLRLDSGIEPQAVSFGLGYSF